MPVHYFDLELRTRAGLTLFRERQPTVYNGQPLQVAAGVFVDVIWDIALSHIDPKVVKMIKPGAVGLTSRRLDRETGEATFKGNMNLSAAQQRLLLHLKQSEHEQRRRDHQNLVKVTERAGDKTKTTAKGVEVDEVR
jgi:hypothetical protein